MKMNLVTELTPSPHSDVSLHIFDQMSDMQFTVSVG
jgi:hypothetical protein